MSRDRTISKAQYETMVRQWGRPRVMETELSRLTRPMVEAAQNAQRAVERSQRRHWWQSVEPDRDALLRAMDDEAHAFNGIFVWVRDRVDAAYEQGLHDGRIEGAPRHEAEPSQSAPVQEGSPSANDPPSPTR